MNNHQNDNCTHSNVDKKKKQREEEKQRVIDTNTIIMMFDYKYFLQLSEHCVIQFKSPEK